MSEKKPSIRPPSTPDEIDAAFRRAISALKGSSEKMTKEAIARRVERMRYIPEGFHPLVKVLRGYDREKLVSLGFPEAKAAKPAKNTRPSRSAHWTTTRPRSWR